MKDTGEDRRYLTIMLVPDGGGEHRNFRISYRRLRLAGFLGMIAAFFLTLMAGSWWYLAARASKVRTLETQLARAQADSSRVEALGRELELIEQQYGDIRGLFGRAPDAPSDLWLPPATDARPKSPSHVPPAEASRPTSWPLTERGIVTQGLLDGVGGEDHPGLDIAVPTDSYVRAAGGGTVMEEGEDSIYGRYVVIDHGDGYTSVYGHASMLFVSRGQHVRRDEVIALSGSTGRSTAPHLHFEILHNGEPVDPLTLVTQP